MNQLDISDYRWLTPDQRQELTDWLHSEGVADAKVIGIRIGGLPHTVVLTCHETNDDGTLKVSVDPEGGHCIFHEERTVEVKHLPPFVEWNPT